ncbi:MAG: regulatory signaling modulator protein AmpE [Perlucidibaca sp.]
MTLLLALLALAAYFALPEDWRQLAGRPVTTWLDWTARFPASLNAGVRLALTLLLPMVVLAIVLQALREVGLSLLVFLPSALVLMVIFGDITQPGAARRHLAHWRERSWAQPAGDAEQTDWVSDEVALASELGEARGELLRESLHELFSPLFWFLLASPVAAVGYYLLRHAARRGSEETRVLAQSWLHLADWVPTRLLALSFALAGNFTATWEVIRERLLKPDAAGHELIDEAAAAAEPAEIDAAAEPAAELAEALEELQGLMQRALIVWMVMLALHTLWPGV